ncbi:MAG TPA: poly-gamma-glutamate system protein, partial [Syntrophorhabdaceae bacterium]|nr:poly-gamma-glutamate system protein [Syntrophorhabdaceae bacterium]
FPSHSVAASMGGKNDRGKEMTESGRRTITQAIERNGLFMIEPSTVKGDIDERMRIYFDRKVPKAYINVGGGRAAVGIRPLKRLLKTGLLTTNLPLDRKTDSLIARFLRQNIPVIQIDNVTELAREYGLPLTPAEMPAMGEGKVYYEKEYNLWLAGGVLLMILFGLFAFIRADWGFRMLEASGKQEAGPPEPMI